MKLGHAATHIAVQSAPRSMKCPVTCRPSLFHRVLASRTSKRPCPTVPAPSPKMKSSNLCPGRMSSGKKDNNSHALSFFFHCHPELPSRLARRLSYKVIINNQQPLLSRSIYYIIIPIEKNYSVVASSRYVCKLQTYVCVYLYFVLGQIKSNQIKSCTQIFAYRKWVSD